ncbi:LPAT4 [Hepatospora eriocheir]|uniref:LPAT4 n=1 Tax=Hepatospora eriocheir TaxID=1081669 RepID=A0A1X0QK81_9MICR|nr:LPAT4 [Hepatospora eriocheir]
MISLLKTIKIRAYKLGMFLTFILVLLFSFPIIILSFITYYCHSISYSIISFYTYEVIIPVAVKWISLTVDIRHRKSFKLFKLSGINLFISNHCTSIDSFIITDYLEDDRKYINILHKKSVMFIPVAGQILKLLKFCTISRNFTEDISVIRDYLRNITKSMISSYILIYPEGTRKTYQKQRESNEFCKLRNIKPFNNVLCPRYKGFKELMNGIYQVNQNAKLIDLTLKYSKSVPSFLDCIIGTKSFTVDIYANVFKIGDISDPKTFLFERFRLKDVILK